MKIVEDAVLALTMGFRTVGPMKPDKELFRLFLSLPQDPFPGFKGPTADLRGRGKDHPRYGRWMYAFIKFYKPDIVLEIGTNAGGTAVGIAKGLLENGKGSLICVDNAEGVPKSFPELARENIKAVGLKDDRFELICGDSRLILPQISARLKGKVDICLVDAAHTFEAAAADIENCMPMMKKGGFILVHDVDKKLDLADETSNEHPYPVWEAFHKVCAIRGLEWCILKFIRKHLGVMKVS